MQQTPQTDKICDHSRGTKHSLQASSPEALWRLLIENPRRAFSHATQSTKHATKIKFARKKQQRNSEATDQESAKYTTSISKGKLQTAATPKTRN